MEQSPPLGPRPSILLRGGTLAYRISPFEGVVLLALLAAAIFGGYTAYARLTDLHATPVAPPTFLPAFRYTLSSSVSTTGSVQASQQVTLTFGSTGKIKEFFVSLGDQVKAGQPLARLDDTQLQQAVQSAQAQLNSAFARYEAALEGPEDTDITGANQSLATARAAVAKAEDDLQELNTKPTPSELSTAMQAVLSAENALQNAKDALTKAQNDVAQAQTDLQTAQQTVSDNYDSLKQALDSLELEWSNCAGPGKPSLPSLPPKGTSASASPSLNSSYCSTTQLTAYNSAAGRYDSARTAYNNSLTALTTKQTALTNAQNTLNSGNLQRSIQNAQLGLDNARQKYAETAAGPTAADRLATRNALDSANAQLASAQAKYDALFQAPTPDVILPLQASVEQARASLETAKKNLADATIVAPFDGQISQLNGEVGSQVGASTAVFILLNPRLVRIDANVDQSDVSSLKVGQTGTVTFDALAGRTYPLTVTAIGLTPTVQQGVVTYVVTFAMDTSRLDASVPIPAPGMTASVTVTTSRTENALVVPSRAIRRVGRTQVVTVKTADGGQEQRQVVAGATNGTLTQIVSGLQDDEQVLVSSGATSTARTTATPARTQQLAPGGGGQQLIPGGGR